MKRLAIAAVVVACGGGPGHRTELDYVTIVSAPVTPSRELDLLFVIDDSPGMDAWQERLGSNLPTLLSELSRETGAALPDVHIGVITTDMGSTPVGGQPGPSVGQVGMGGCAGTGDGGALQTFGAPVTGTFISDVAQTTGTRTRNYTGDLATVLGQMLRGAGAGGCGFEQPLHALQRAVTNNPANAGFLRPSAVLGVVVLADEDDCSFASTSLLDPESAALGPLQSFRCTRFGVTCEVRGDTPDAMNTVGDKAGCVASIDATYVAPVASLADALIALKGTKLAVAVIAGDPEPVTVEEQSPPGGGTPHPALAPSCSWMSPPRPGFPADTVPAEPGVRFHSFVEALDGHGRMHRLCEADITTQLRDVATTLRQAMGSTCLATALPDADRSEPGVQPSCIVEDVVGTSVTEIPSCDDGGQTCWRLEVDLEMCSSGDHQKLVITRAAAPDPSTITRMATRFRSAASRGASTSRSTRRIHQTSCQRCRRRSCPRSP